MRNDDMSRIKSNALKMWLAKKTRSNRGVPTFVVAKTKMKVRTNRKKRTWRTDKLGTRGVKKKLFKGCD
jgi:ribosomal protein L39E